MKPHIYFRNGYWQVSRMSKPFTDEAKLLWGHAHKWVGEMNAKVLQKQFTIFSLWEK